AQSDRTSEKYIVVSGLVRVTAGEGESARVVAELGAGACFGEMRLLTGRGASATVGSLTPCTVLVVRGEAFHEAMAQGGAFSRNVGMILAERLRAANRRSVAQNESAVVPVLA